MQREAKSRSKDGLLVASGAALMLVALLVLQSLVGSGLLSAKTLTVTVTTSDAYEQVVSAFSNHLLQFSVRDNALVSGYENNATMEWTGAEAAGTGKFSGSTDIGIQLKSFTGKFVNFSLSDKYQSIGVNRSVSVVNARLDFRGFSSVVGVVNGTIIAQDVYAHVGSSWLIARETWNFTQFNEPFPIT